MQENEISPDFVLCIGDDRSDDDMFEVITTSMTATQNAEVFACTVGQKPSKAKYYLDDTAEIVRLMQGLASVSEQTVTV
jgi:trehalose 6-phosphate synthase/phosphatase